MAIRFSCEVTDPDTQALLNFLEQLTGNDADRMLTVLDCAKDWLRMEAPIQSHRGDGRVKSSLELVDEEDGRIAPPPSQSPSLHPSA